MTTPDRETDPQDGSWQLRLHVAGHTAKSVNALHNLERLCEAHLAGRYTIEVIDLLVHPELARSETHGFVTGAILFR